MDVATYALILVLFIGGAFWYSQSKIKNKLLCTFRRANKTRVEMLVPIKSRYVFFDNGRYNINPKCITLFWYNRGVHQFFPTWMPSLDFNWNSPEPLDPSNFQQTWKTPEASASSQQEDSFKAFAKGIQSQAGVKKSAFPEWLFPVIILGVLAVLGFWIYQMGQHIGTIEQIVAQSQGMLP